ncbi:hypothetical protein [Cellulomonas sp. ATA003]|uniref:hypothetical protein n=1 Tax=Cellulomonas sp. ATA003 TaxID=3073064 RepID=UPI002872DF54|nr:hypothetical protein [Cellulomonas sp. ATA003]WNB86081.1 hypothetical protein REH70_01985 [Cellulomonas sp. ATA003]
MSMPQVRRTRRRGQPVRTPGESTGGHSRPPAEGRPGPAAWPNPASTPPDGDAPSSSSSSSQGGGPGAGGARPPGVPNPFGGPTPPGGPTPLAGPTPPEKPPLTPEQVEATRVASRRALRFYAFFIAGLVTLPLPVPWQGASLVFVLAAVGVGVHGFVQAWRGGVRGATLAALGIMVGVAGLVALMMASLLAVWPEQLERQRCLAGAVTISATRECDDQFERAVQERLVGTRPAPTG